MSMKVWLGKGTDKQGCEGKVKDKGKVKGEGAAKSLSLQHAVARSIAPIL